MQFQPQTSRDLADFFSSVCKKWKSLSDEQKASGEYINPDEPVVLTVPNPDFTGPSDDDKEMDDDGNWRTLYFHVESHGGGGDEDEDGTDVGHQGAAIDGMEIDEDNFLFNGRRHISKAAQ
jgi:hypothetical protein